jgi:RND family efflux transporter MFP subunit
MRHSDPTRPGSPELEPGDTTEERLRREIEDLKRQLRQQSQPGHGGSHTGVGASMWRPSGITITAIVVGIAAVLAAAFFTGYIPLAKQNTVIRQEAEQQERAVPRAEVIQVQRSSPKATLQLPGNIQAVTEAPILARADGYVRRRMVDIGDRIRAGQPMAEIEAPELDQQIRQARATLQQAQAALEQALANQQQGKANLQIAQVTAERWKTLAAQGVVSRQENDQYQAQYQAQLANVQALEKAVAAQRSNIAAAEANLARLDEIQSYRVVKAPFDGVVTLRNVDVGALVNAGNTLLFRVAQTGTLRLYVNVPEADAAFVHPGQPARLTVASLPGREFSGTLVRTANAVDPSSRTLLCEIEVPNGGGALLPGMYAQVQLTSDRKQPPLLIPGEALVFRAEGTQVALLNADHTVHLQNIQVGRDYGTQIEVITGLREGDTILANPGDMAREGIKVDPIQRGESAKSSR